MKVLHLIFALLSVSLFSQSSLRVYYSLESKLNAKQSKPTKELYVLDINTEENTTLIL